MPEISHNALTRLGFRFGINGPHAARTMMLKDLQTLLANIPTSAERSDYVTAVVAYNVLGKPTKKARELSLRHLTTLYGLDSANPIFRALRRLWDANSTAQAQLALVVALARDPLLRASKPLILSWAVGKLMPREEVEAFLARTFPDRFSPASLKSFAQNIAGTWTDAGFLKGRRRKTRSAPQVQPEAVVLSLFLAFLEGRSGERLFSSEWLDLWGAGRKDLEELARSASHRGLLVFMNAGGVHEFRFPDYLTAEEETIRLEAAHVL